MIVYVSIGNSDDKLTQRHWHDFHEDVRCELIGAGADFHGQWSSPSTDVWQNACWCVEVVEGVVAELKRNLAEIATRYGQDSIAWAEAPTTEFLAASP